MVLTLTVPVLDSEFVSQTVNKLCEPYAPLALCIWVLVCAAVTTTIFGLIVVVCSSFNFTVVIS